MNLRYLFVLSAVISAAAAHEDDIGDVHPKVVVEGDRFAVYFQNNENDDFANRPKFKSILDREGKVITDRELVTEIPNDPIPEYVSNEHVPDEFTQGPDAFFTISNWETDENGNPILMQWTRKKQREIPLDWDDSLIGWIYGLAVTESAYILTVSQTKPLEPDPKGADKILRWYVFSRNEPQNLTILDIGNPVRIYDFPQTSEYKTFANCVYVAWMGWEKDRGHGLFLTQLDLDKMTAISKRVSDGHGNSPPSIGLLDGKILIAHHKPKTMLSYMGKDARVVTHCLSLAEFFPNTGDSKTSTKGE